MMGRTNMLWIPRKTLSVFRKSNALNLGAGYASSAVDITPDGKALAFTGSFGGADSRAVVMRGSGTPYVYTNMQYMTTANANPWTQINISNDSQYISGGYNIGKGGFGLFSGYFSGQTLNMFSSSIISGSGNLRDMDLSSNGKYFAYSATTGTAIMKQESIGSNVWVGASSVPSSNKFEFFGNNDDLLGVLPTSATIYKRNGDIFTEQTSFNVSIGTLYGIGIGSNGVCAFAGSSDPYITFLEYDGNTLKESDISVDFDIGLPRSLALSNDGNYLAVGHIEEPYLVIAQKQGNTFKKLPDPDVMPPYVVTSCAFTENGERLLVGGSEIILYER